MAASVKVRRGVELVVIVAIVIARMDSLVQGGETCLLAPQLCAMKDEEFDPIFNTCKEFNQGRRVPSPDADCCKRLNSLTGSCLCRVSSWLHLWKVHFPCLDQAGRQPLLAESHFEEAFQKEGPYSRACSVTLIPRMND